MNRIITLVVSEEFANITADNGGEVNAAVGRLSMWAIHNERYAAVAIYGDHQGNLNATYRNAAGEVTYSMAAMRRENGSYGFHS